MCTVKRSSTCTQHIDAEWIAVNGHAPGTNSHTHGDTWRPTGTGGLFRKAWKFEDSAFRYTCRDWHGDHVPMSSERLSEAHPPVDSAVFAGSGLVFVLSIAHLPDLQRSSYTTVDSSLTDLQSFLRMCNQKKISQTLTPCSAPILPNGSVLLLSV